MIPLTPFENFQKPTYEVLVQSFGPVMFIFFRCLLDEDKLNQP